MHACISVSVPGFKNTMQFSYSPNVWIKSRHISNQQSLSYIQVGNAFISHHTMSKYNLWLSSASNDRFWSKWCCCYSQAFLSAGIQFGTCCNTGSCWHNTLFMVNDVELIHPLPIHFDPFNETIHPPAQLGIVDLSKSPPPQQSAFSGWCVGIGGYTGGGWQSSEERRAEGRFFDGWAGLTTTHTDIY